MSRASRAGNTATSRTRFFAILRFDSAAFSPRPANASAARAGPILRLSDDAAENARFWSELPGVFWCVGVERAKPGAAVLAVNPVRTNAYGKRVLLAVHSFGAGRCYFSAVDSTWRWRW